MGVESRHQLLKRMDCYQREEGVELLPLPVLGLELQMDYYQGEVALLAHSPLLVHHLVGSLQVQQEL